MQVGLEYIGEVDAYATLEVLLLAQKSLKAISDAYILDVSHMGFVAGLMEEVALPYAQQDRILDCISEKNIHGIRAVCKENGVAADLTERLEGLASLYGSLEETLPQAKALCCNEKMEQAVQELENILRCLKIGGNEEKVNLDFSIVNDMDYYTGIIFQGFINGVPSSILSGGRYDNLLRKLGKDADAIGFAVYLDLLERFDSKEKEYDVDTLLLYEEGADVAALAQAAQMLTDNGQSVLVLANASKAFALERAKKHGIPAEFVSKKQAGSDEAFNDIILQKLKAADADLVVLAGYLPILGRQVVRAYEHRIINIHPALIPAFCGPGMYGHHVHEAVLAYGAKISGATTHFVDEQVDHGGIIMQRSVPVLEGDTPDTLAARVLTVEHQILPESVKLFCAGKLGVDGRQVHVL